jgi:hypothetical protein
MPLVLLSCAGYNHTSSLNKQTPISSQEERECHNLIHTIEKLETIAVLGTPAVKSNATGKIETLEKRASELSCKRNKPGSEQPF